MSADFPTRLISKIIDTPTDAQWQIGHVTTQGGYRIAPVVLIPKDSATLLWCSVPAGFIAVVTSHDKYQGLWGSGLNYCGPFTKVSHLIPQSYIVYDTPVKECPTADNVMVQIDVTLVFHIKQNEADIKNFIYKLGPEKLDTMLKAFQEESVREMARKRKYTEIYDLMDTSADKQMETARRTLNDGLHDYGVEVKHITITNVHLPRQFAETMQEATTFDSLNTYQNIQQVYKLLTIENTEKAHQRQQQVKEEREELQAEMNKKQAQAKAGLAQVDAESSKIISEIKEKERAEILAIKSNSGLKVSQVDSEKKIELASIKSTGQAESDRIRVECDASVRNMRADADLVVAQNEAKILSLKADAEKMAATKLKSKRDFDAKMRQLRVLKALAENQQLTISGNNGDNMIAQLVSAKNQGVTLGLPSM